MLCIDSGIFRTVGQDLTLYGLAFFGTLFFSSFYLPRRPRDKPLLILTAEGFLSYAKFPRSPF